MQNAVHSRPSRKAGEPARRTIRKVFFYDEFGQCTFDSQLLRERLRACQQHQWFGPAYALGSVCFAWPQREGREEWWCVVAYRDRRFNCPEALGWPDLYEYFLQNPSVAKNAMRNEFYISNNHSLTAPYEDETSRAAVSLALLPKSAFWFRR